MAVKVLRSPNGHRDARARLRREALALARLSHPNIVEIYDVGTHGPRDRQIFIAMSLVEGQTLDAWLVAEPRSLDEVVRLFVCIGRGLAAAHEAGLLHRDIKPANILIDGNNRPLLVDFGLASVGRRAPAEDGPRVPDGVPETGIDLHDHPFEGRPLEESLTATGGLLGSPAYMASEVFEGRTADARTDQFAYCVALFEALCGERPFAADTLIRLAGRILAGQRSHPPRLDELQPGLRQALLRGLSTDPDQRWPTMGHLVEALEQSLVPARVRKPGRSRSRARTPAAKLTLACGVGLAMLGLGLLPQDPSRVPGSCSIEPERMDELWNDERRRELGSALRGIDVPFAEDGVEQVLTALDRHAAGWVFRATQLCEAESETSVIDPSHHFLLACFSQSLNRTEAALGALAGLDRSSVSQAMDVVLEELFLPDQCYSRREWRDRILLGLDPAEALFDRTRQPNLMIGLPTGGGDLARDQWRGSFPVRHRIRARVRSPKQESGPAVDSQPSSEHGLE